MHTRRHPRPHHLALLALSSLGVLGCGSTPDEATSAAASNTPASVAAVEEAHGVVERRGRDATTYSAAAAGHALFPADTLRTGLASGASVHFMSGATARLGPNSLLRIPGQMVNVTRMRHSEGELVARALGPAGRRVEVELPPGTLVLESDGRGAGGAPEARVDVANDRVEVSMIGGAGTLRRAGSGAPVELAAGEYIALTRAGVVLDEGHAGEPVALVSPPQGATVRTRDTVTFTWSPLPDVTSYLIEVRGGDAPLITRVVGTSHTGELPNGNYTWLVRALAGEEALPPSEQRAVVVNVDRQAPELALNSPAEGASTATPTVQVTGQTEPGATLTINGEPVPVDADGRFATTFPLRIGLSNLVFAVQDDLGNRATRTRTVIRH